MKRFFKTVSLAEDAHGHAVLLDGRELRTPAKRQFRLPTPDLAAAVAAEWDAQADKVDPQTMPLMRLAATAIDRVAAHRGDVVDQIAAYAGSDLTCYRAEAPAKLMDRQHEAWAPLLDWAQRRYDVTFTVTSGVMHVAQPDATLATMHRVVAGADDFTLSGLATLTQAAGSLVIALALKEGEIDADQAFAAAEVDETFQAEQWGEDAEAADRRAGVRTTIAEAARFLSLLGN